MPQYTLACSGAGLFATAFSGEWQNATTTEGASESMCVCVYVYLSAGCGQPGRRRESRHTHKPLEVYLAAGRLLRRQELSGSPA